ncbi:serpin 4B [Anopheles sinensis]|uniref:Serpin 4B n=1 Tax=Anopheles sinensis TaxID=74873 RepID=A0A084VSL0_ANOSI|nr:serpin 4B [Anopheles sinensis]
MRSGFVTSWMLVAVVLATLLAVSPASAQGGGFKKAMPQQKLERLQANPTSVNQVSDSVTNLAQKIARAIASPKSKTEIFSPVSIAGALSLLLLGASGRTQQELMRVMGFSDGQLSFQEIHFAFGRLFQDLVANDPTLVPLVTWRVNDKCNRYDEEEDYEDEFPPANTTANTLPYEFDPTVHEISLANGVFLHQDYRLSNSYRNHSAYLYNSEVQALDFAGNPSGSTKLINEWVGAKTHGKIPNILATILPPSTSMVLASAMYFKALWEETFIDGATRQREFYPDGKENPSVMVDMMAHGGCFPFYESPELDARILGLPYKNRLTTMYIIMPNNSTRAKLRKLIAVLDATKLNQMIGRMKMKTTVMLFPKMHVSEKVDLKSALQKLGVQTLFDSRYSDLSSMVTETDPMGDQFYNRLQGAPFSPAPVLRPTVNMPVYEPNRKTTMDPNNDLKESLVFSRFDNNDSDSNEQTNSTDAEMEEKTTLAMNPTTTKLPEKHRKKRDVTYKAPSSRHVHGGPLSSKDFILNKRIVKEKGSVGKKSVRRRSKRSQVSVQNLYVSDAVHQIDLEINKRVRKVVQQRSVVFRTEAPFLLLIRNDNTALPLFYGAVYDPR